MATFLKLSQSPRRVAIAGKVIDAVTAEPVARAVATITKMSEAFQRWVDLRAEQARASWGSLAERPDRTVTAADGCFRFLDLPDGAYTVSVASQGSGLRYGTALRDFTVQRDQGGNIAALIAVIELPPTGLRGRVERQGSETPLPLARVRVEGSGELAYCDADGRFYLPFLETGSRRLSVSAAGHRRATATAQVAEGKVIDLGTIVLQPATA